MLRHEHRTEAAGQTHALVVGVAHALGIAKEELDIAEAEPDDLRVVRSRQLLEEEQTLERLAENHKLGLVSQGANVDPDVGPATMAGSHLDALTSKVCSGTATVECSGSALPARC